MTATDSTTLHGNRVRSGSIGIAAVDPFLLRELGVRVHDFTGGVSAGVEAVGGGLLEAIDRLEADASTAVLLVGAGAESAQAVIERLARAAKPAVLCVLGAGAALAAEAEGAGVVLRDRSKPAALAAVVAGGVDASTLDLHALNWPLIDEVRAKLGRGRRSVRGLFLGSAQCEEAAALAEERHGAVHRVVPTGLAATAGGELQRGHVFVDYSRLGDAHPGAHPAIRAERLVREAADPEVGVIVLDFVLGADAHPDPVGVMAHALAEARRIAAADGRHVELLGYVLGTELDEQDLADQLAKLDAAGVTWASSATNTGLLAREFVSTAARDDAAA